MSTPSSLPGNPYKRGPIAVNPYKRGPIAKGKKHSKLNGTIHGRNVASQPNGKLEDNKPLHSYSSLATVLLFSLWYLLTVVFNILNKKILNYFPYPYFVSAVQLLVGAIYCMVSWTFSIPKRAPCDSTLFKLLIPVAVCHGLGHTLGSVSFAKVPISFIQTIKVLEPFFNAAATRFILKQSVPLPLWLSLTPIVIGVTMASLTELSFNWTGFNGVMFSNVVFTYRNIYLKKAMTNMDSTNLYAYTSIIALFVCMPLAAIIEGPQLIQYGIRDVIAKVGLNKFLWDMFSAGICYHLFNQFANNILERVTPLTLAVGNVSKRIIVIVASVIIFGNKISTQAGIGTCIAISGVALYSWIKAKMEGRKMIKKAERSRKSPDTRGRKDV